MLHAAGRLALALNCTLVEPCVADGAVVSCAAGRVPRVADGSRASDLAAVERGEEPDGDAASRLLRNGSCRHGGNQLPRWSAQDAVLPLSAYYDWRWLAARYPMARWHEWEAARVAPRGASAADALGAGQLWVDPASGVIATPYSAVMGAGRVGGNGYGCSPGAESATVRFGGFEFRGHTCPEGSSFVADPQQLLRDGVERGRDVDVFVVRWYNHGHRFMDHTGHFSFRQVPPLPPFNPLVYAAARWWVRHALRAGSPDARYGVVQWR